MTAVEELTQHLLEISRKHDLERDGVKRKATDLTRRSQAFVAIVEAALSTPRNAKVLSHVRVVRMMVLTQGALSVELELTGIKVQVAGMELDFTPEIQHQDGVSSLQVIVRSGLDDRMTITEGTDGGWHLRLPGAETTVPADEEAIARLLLNRIRQTPSARSQSFSHTPYLSFAHRSHR